MLLKQIANEVWKKLIEEMNKDDNKKVLEHYIKPVNDTVSDLKMYFILMITVQVIISILIFLILTMFFIYTRK